MVKSGGDSLENGCLWVGGTGGILGRRHKGGELKISAGGRWAGIGGGRVRLRVTNTSTPLGLIKKGELDIRQN